MARMKFLCDSNRCINCDGCSVMCKNANNVPAGMFRRRVVVIREGQDGEAAISMACMHCSDPPSCLHLLTLADQCLVNDLLVVTHDSLQIQGSPDSNLR